MCYLNVVRRFIKKYEPPVFMLLVERDVTGLFETRGLVRDFGLPSILTTPWIVPSEYNTDETSIRKLKELFHLTPEAPLHLAERLAFPVGIGGMLAYWSGFRSVVTYDPETGRWYKLKGVTSDLNNLKQRDRYGIQGAQKRINADLEWRMSECFNRALESEGIEPVMRVRGIWSYPGSVAGMRPTATVAEVKGDTRLDELLATLETSAYLADIHAFPLHTDAFSRFYAAAGYAVGQLLRVMHRSGQVWGTSGDQTNAHPGNVVVYIDKNRVRFGLVDFDISAGKGFYSNGEVDKQQRKDFTNFDLCLRHRQVRSVKPLAVYCPGYNTKKKPVWTTTFGCDELWAIRALLHMTLANGFKKGYEHQRTYRTSIDAGLLYEAAQYLGGAENEAYATFHTSHSTRPTPKSL